DGERVYDDNINILTTIVNESFTEFVEGYQKELTDDTGIKFGYLVSHSFNLVVTDIDEGGKPIYLGQDDSTKIFKHFIEKGYIDNKGKIQDSLKSALQEDAVALGMEVEEAVRKQIINLIKQVAGSLEIKNNADKVPIQVNKEVYLSEDFRTLWDSIKYKTMYRVNFSSEELIKKCVASINDNVRNQQSHIEYVKGKLGVTQGGVFREGDGNTYIEQLDTPVNHLPDIITYLQNETDLTRRTIVKILKGIEPRVLRYFTINPQAFIESCIEVINLQKRLFIVDGIEYQPINEYYDQKLIEEEDLIGYLSKRMVEASKSAYAYTVCDSDVEVNLAREFERSENISLYKIGRAHV